MWNWLQERKRVLDVQWHERCCHVPQINLLMFCTSILVCEFVHCAYCPFLIFSLRVHAAALRFKGERKEIMWSWSVDIINFVNNACMPAGWLVRLGELAQLLWNPLGRHTLTKFKMKDYGQGKALKIPSACTRSVCVDLFLSAFCQRNARILWALCTALSWT